MACAISPACSQQSVGLKVLLKAKTCTRIFTARLRPWWNRWCAIILLWMAANVLGRLQLACSLRINGYRLACSQKELVVTAVQVATGELRVNELADWLRAHSRQG